MRFFLGVGRYTPNDVVAGEMGWKPTVVRQWKSVYLYWAKLSKIDNNRVNKELIVGARQNLIDHVKTGFIQYRTS